MGRILKLLTQALESCRSEYSSLQVTFHGAVADSLESIPQNLTCHRSVKSRISRRLPLLCSRRRFSPPGLNYRQPQSSSLIWSK